jgi:hypothetical protein
MIGMDVGLGIMTRASGEEAAGEHGQRGSSEAGEDT